MTFDLKLLLTSRITLVFRPDPTHMLCERYRLATQQNLLPQDSLIILSCHTANKQSWIFGPLDQQDIINNFLSCTPTICMSSAGLVHPFMTAVL